jgi:hypothetical protein
LVKKIHCNLNYRYYLRGFLRSVLVNEISRKNALGGFFLNTKKELAAYHISANLQ